MMESRNRNDAAGYAAVFTLDSDYVVASATSEIEEAR
jgi:hypothetical protein